MNDKEKVTLAWGAIHRRHPGAHETKFPRSIRRLGAKDFQRLIAATCRLIGGDNILEAGCGSGRDALYLAGLGFTCVALDFYMTPLEQLRHAAESAGSRTMQSTASLSMVNGDIFALPFRDNTFKLIFNSGVIEHYNRETRRRLLNEMTRTIKDQGHLCVKFPNKFHIMESWWETLIARYSDKQSYDIPEQPITMKDMREDLEYCGLRNVIIDWSDTYETISLYPNWLPLRIISTVATIVLPRPPRFLRKLFGTRIVAIGQKP